MSKFLATLEFLALGLLAVPVATAQKLLPPTLDGWERTETHSSEAATLEELAGPEAPVWREYGATRAERAVYRQQSHRLTVTLVVLRDAVGAYGAFSFFGAGGRRLAQVGPLARACARW
ncbi:MAG: hypothetical protein ACE5MH_09195 [Terriglobia bacterium]